MGAFAFMVVAENTDCSLHITSEDNETFDWCLADLDCVEEERPRGMTNAERRAEQGMVDGDGASSDDLDCSETSEVHSNASTTSAASNASPTTREKTQKLLDTFPIVVVECDWEQTVRDDPACGKAAAESLRSAAAYMADADQPHAQENEAPPVLPLVAADLSSRDRDAVYSACNLHNSYEVNPYMPDGAPSQLYRCDEYTCQSHRINSRATFVVS